MLLLSLRPSPSLPFRRALLCRCSITTTSLTPYKQSFARRMAMAGIHPHHRIAVGVSGGPDSMALCVLAAAWKAEGLGKKEEDVSGFLDGLLGIVVDHRLRPESAVEARVVRDRVRNMGVRCEIANCEWPDGRPKQGHLQEAAREMRYQKLLDICIKQKIGILLIAHHSDDQAELFVLRLSRNSGVLGLAGTAFMTQLFPANLKYNGENFSRYGILLVRPMLDFSKDDMYKVCQEGNQLWVEDPTNNSMLYARNRIRASLRSLCMKGTFWSELQRLISACRLTRAYINNTCSEITKQSVTIMEYGYAIIDLEELKPLDVDDLCLSQFLACVLQFISQRHRPLRGRSARLLMDYIRSIPCKTSFTVAGCYLCAAPQSKGRKVLVCCSVDSVRSSAIEISYQCSHKEQQPTIPEIDQIILQASLYSYQFVQKCSSVPFMGAKSATDVLNKAKDLNLISDLTFEHLSYLRTEEHEKFTTRKEVNSEEKWLDKTCFPDSSIVNLCPGETCHFMSRFLVAWKCPKVGVVNGICSDVNQKHLCQFCMVDQERSLAVRHMVDTDWLFLAEVSNSQTAEEQQNDSIASSGKLEDNKIPKAQNSKYMQLSAKRALEILRSIPASARRALPVLTSSRGNILSVPSIGFRCCPGLSVDVVFSPRVPLGGGYTSYL